MAEPIGPGDLVECIVECHEGSPGVLAHWLCGACIERGRIYTIDHVVAGVDNLGEDTFGYVLVEPDTRWPSSVLGGEPGAWCHFHFRPVGRPAEALIRALSEPVEEIRRVGESSFKGEPHKEATDA